MRKIHSRKKHTSSKKKLYIALLYHFVPMRKKAMPADSQEEKYFSKEHAIVDNQTNDIIRYMKKLFLKKGYRVQVIKVSPYDLSELKKIRADFVFNLVDSKAMELRIARILDRLKLPHSGSSFDAIRTSNNKIKSKRVFEKNNLPTPKYTLIHPKNRITRQMLPSKFPLIIKPAFEHCSIGITDKSIVQTYSQFRTAISRMRKVHKQTLIAEQFIPGRELQVTILEKDTETQALPIAEIVFRKYSKNKWNIYGFDEKWVNKSAAYKNARFISPPRRLHATIDQQIKRDSIRAFYALGLKDYARFDLRYNPKIHQWYFLEANANAGFDPGPHDAMAASVRAHGMTFDDFVLQIVRNSIH